MLLLQDKKYAGPPLWVGIGIHGVLVSDRQLDPQRLVHRHTWLAVHKVSFNKRRFGILPKSETGFDKAQKLKYYTDTYKK